MGASWTRQGRVMGVMGASWTRRGAAWNASWRGMDVPMAHMEASPSPLIFFM